MLLIIVVARLAGDQPEAQSLVSSWRFQTVIQAEHGMMKSMPIASLSWSSMRILDHSQASLCFCCCSGEPLLLLVY